MRQQVVTGYPLYKIFDSGHVYSIVNKMFLKGDVDRYGYLYFTLYNDEGSKHHTAHRLVAIHFIRGDHLLHVNHKDGNKLNNDYRNLEWVTPLQNVQHSIDFLGRDYTGIKNPAAKLNEETVIKIKTDLLAGVSQWTIARKYNVNRSTVSMIAINKIWSTIKIIQQHGTEKEHCQVGNIQKNGNG